MAGAKHQQAFQEIGHAGGCLEIKYEAGKHGNGSVGVKYTHSNSGGCAMMQMGVALDGSITRFWPIYGVHSNPPDPSPMVSTLLISDRERMWGRECPACHAYFRTNHAGQAIICPYCAHRARNDEFTTKNQRAFIDRIRKGYLEALESKKDVVLDLDKIADDLPENRPAWAYNEERQQNTYVCKAAKCDTRYDVLGRYAGCPNCGYRNSLQVFDGDLAAVAEKLKLAGPEAHAVVESDLLGRCFSDFEAMAKDVQGQLAILPVTPRRRKQVEAISFQRMAEAQQNIEAWFGIDIWAGLSADERKSLLQSLARRHLFTHNGGRVDEKYLEQTGDTTVRLHQQVDVRRDEIERVMRVLRKCAGNLFEGSESITA